MMPKFDGWLFLVWISHSTFINKIPWMLAAVLMLILGVKFCHDDIQLQQKKLALVEHIRHQTEEIALLKAYEKSMNALMKDIAPSPMVLVRQNEWQDVLECVAQKAALSQLAVESIMPLGMLQDDFYVERALSLVLKGNYVALRGFVKSLSQLNWLMTWHDVSLDADDGVLRLKLGIKFYQQIE